MAAHPLPVAPRPPASAAVLLSLEHDLVREADRLKRTAMPAAERAVLEQRVAETLASVRVRLGARSSGGHAHAG